MGTDYCVDGEAPFVMRIGEPCEALAAMYAADNYTACVSISARNRLGAPSDDTERSPAGRLCPHARGAQPALPVRRGAQSARRASWSWERDWKNRRQLAASCTRAPLFCEEDCIPHLILLR